MPPLSVSSSFAQGFWVTVGDVPFAARRREGAPHPPHPPKEEEEGEEDGEEAASSFAAICAHYDGQQQGNTGGEPSTTAKGNNRTVAIWCDRPLRGRYVGLHVWSGEAGRGR